MANPTWSFDIPWRDPGPNAPPAPWCWVIVSFVDGKSIGGSIHQTAHGRDAIQYVVTIPNPDDLSIIVFVARYRSDDVASITHVDRDAALDYTFAEPDRLPFTARTHPHLAGLLPMPSLAARGVAQ